MIKVATLFTASCRNTAKASGVKALPTGSSAPLRFALISVLALACSLAGAAPVYDATFGVNGTVRIGDVGTPSFTASAAVELSDGRIVAVGLSPPNTLSQTTLLRFTADGLPDPSFGNLGRTTLPEPIYCLESQRAVRKLDDSVVVVMSSGRDSSCAKGIVSGARVSADGTRDAAFQIAGLPDTNTPRPIHLSKDKLGSLYIVGTAEDIQSGYTYLARLNSLGILDPSPGLVRIEEGNAALDRAGVVATLDDGSFLTASLTGDVLLLSHFDLAGSPIQVVSGATSRSISLQPAAPNNERLRLINFFRLADGANLAVMKREGATNNALIIVRTAGDFSTAGISLLISSAVTTDWPVATALRDGTVVIAEVTGAGASRQASLRRMFANSSFDPSWGTGRAFALGVGSSVTAMSEDAAGRLLLLGTDSRGAFLSRFNLNLTPFVSTTFTREFHNAGLNHYFMTADSFESNLIELGYAGPGWSKTPYGIRVYTEERGIPAATVRVCRFYGNRAVNPDTGQPYGPNSHVFVLDGPECDAVRRDRGWVFEGFAFSVFAPAYGQCGSGQDPVYRLYNNRFAQNDSNHRFTTSASVFQQMRAAGWIGEGVVMCAPQ